MSKYLGHFEVHDVEIGDNTYLDILTEKEKEILEYLGECNGFGEYFEDRDSDAPPHQLYLKEISDEDAKVILKHIHYCKSYFNLIQSGLDDLYYNKFGKGSDDGFTLEQVKQLVNDTDI